jgi:hypothetical protein
MPKQYSRLDKNLDENLLKHYITEPLVILIKRINKVWIILNNRDKQQDMKIEELEERIKTLETLVLNRTIGIN